MEKVKTKKKAIKRLINKRTIDQAIEALLDLSRSGYGSNVITVEAKIAKAGLTWLTPDVNITIDVVK